MALFVSSACFALLVSALCLLMEATLRSLLPCRSAQRQQTVNLQPRSGCTK